MDFLFDYGLFLAKIATFVIALLVILVLVKSSNQRSGAQKGHLEVLDLSKQYRDNVEQLSEHLVDEQQRKIQQKQERKAEKAKQKEQQKSLKKAAKEGKVLEERQPHVFVLDFKGGIDAKEVSSLREEISAILAVAKEGDEVLLRLESGGGMVHAYGLASSQLDRIKKAGLPLTISVDKVAASGGYMMACVADKIVSAPFAIVGSIGVIAQIPNFNKVLKKYDIEYEQLTAGEYKRTLTMFGENSDKARDKFKQELEETHGLFKQFIEQHRPSLALDEVATGEHWFGIKAHQLGLVDELSTSDELLATMCQEKSVLQIRYAQKKKISDRLSGAGAKLVDGVLLKLAERGKEPIV
ncbi:MULTISPECIES: protease SohB [unclassified Vibrio]|uniref:Protease SohB n=1 Tax=Vibrio sp. HB236076 TaxID=3232307 RepID=A0AB39HD03_9VIBR|nr:protease SohB [Vibrio sp. HB161653]MDP5253679.1 protease SohB [Vibrio sp. HB161653]